MTAPVSVSSEDRHTRLFWLIALAIPLAFTELFGFAATRLSDIAEELAFADPSHFARFFRKQTGTTPHEFRAQTIK